MKKNRLTKETIINEAIDYIEKTGQPVAPLHELARRLCIKTPSLYNYFKNQKELQYEIFQCAINKFVANQKNAINGKYKDEAVVAFAKAYFLFAKNNKGLYRLIMLMPSENDDTEKKMAVSLLDTVILLLSDYDLKEESIIHWQRVFRAILHGFITQEDLGCFYYFNDSDLQKSREIAIQCFLNGLHTEIRSSSW